MNVPNMNQLTSQVARMSDQQLRQLAENNKGNAIIVSIALSEMTQRKNARTAQQGQMGQQQQPRVVDQAIAGMSQGLPEDSGIGMLPAPNMQSMAGGGITGFKEGGSTSQEGANLFNQALAAEGITDPRQIAFLRALHAQESGGRSSSKNSSRGAIGPMQVMPGTFKEVAPDLNINNSLDNMRAGIRYGVKGFTAARGDPVLAGAYYYGGPGGMNALAQGEVRVNPKDKTGREPNTLEYGQSIASRMTALLPIGSAQAGAQAANPASTGATSQIPTEGYSSAPASNAQPQGFFSRIGTGLGMSEDSQRQFSNLTNAIGGATGAGNLARLGNVLPKAEGIAALPTANNAAQVLGATAPVVPLRVQQAQAAQAAARATAQNPNVIGPFQPAGIQAAAQAAKVPGAIAQVPGAVAQTATKVPGAVAQVAPTVAQTATKVPEAAAQVSRLLPTAVNAQRGVNATRLVGGSSVIAPGIDPGIVPTETAPYSNEGRNSPAPNITAEDKKEIIADAKKVAPEQKRRGFTGEDWLTLGLGLMSGKSPYAFQNLGDAGMSVIANRREQKKADSLESLQAMQAKYQGAIADQIISGEKLTQQQQVESAKLVATEMDKWRQSIAGIQAMNDPNAEANKRLELTEYYQRLFSGGTMPAAPPTGSGSGNDGFKVIGSRAA